MTEPTKPAPATDDLIAKITPKDCGVYRYTFEVLIARIEAEKALREELVAALEALRWRQKHAKPIMWGILKDADDVLARAEAWKKEVER